MTLGGVPTERWYAKLNIDGHTVRFLLDCGATVNLIPESVVRSLGRLDDMRPAVSALRMFDKSKLQTSGMIKLAIEHQRTLRIYDLEFYVAAKHEQALLGFTACQKLQLLRLVEENVCAVRMATASDASMLTKRSFNNNSCVTETEILTEYADLFDGIGLIDGDVHLEIDNTVQPVQMPLRRLPIGVRDKVAAELQRLEDSGIISPVTEPTSWVLPLLVVAKANGGVRICIDPKKTLN